MISQGPDRSEQEINDTQVPNVRRYDWLNLIQFIFSLITGSLFFGGALLTSLFLLVSGPSSNQVLPEFQILSSWMFASGLAFAGILMIPSVIQSGKGLLGVQDSGKLNWQNLTWIIILVPILILVGYWVQIGPPWVNRILPIIHPLANSAAVFWILTLVYRRISSGSSKRFWGSFGSGLTVIPILAFIIEIIILITLALFWFIALSTQPEIQQELIEAINLVQSYEVSPEIIEEAMVKLVNQPGVIPTVFLYIAVLVPIVEEVLKSSMIWIVLRRKISPLDGFLIGAASGAGYALFENLTIGSTADVWTFVTITRIGTAAIHILTTGIVGWGITSAFKEKKYLRLLSSFFASILLHGVWNGLNILTALMDFLPNGSVLGSFGINLANFAPVALIILALGSFVGLYKANSWFQRAIITPSNEKSEV